MSKYASLWKSIEEDGSDSLTLSFEAIVNVLGFPIDHSFLNAKGELTSYGYWVEKYL